MLRLEVRDHGRGVAVVSQGFGVRAAVFAVNCSTARRLSEVRPDPRHLCDRDAQRVLDVSAHRDLKN